MTTAPGIDAYAEAVTRLLAALNALGKPAAAEAALSSGVRLERFGFGPRQGQLVQIIEGLGPVTAWLQLTPKGTHFALEGEPAFAGEGVAAVAYRLTHEDFVNGGEWRWRLGDDGRIAWLEHRPKDLPETAEETIARLARRGPPMVPNKLALEEALEQQHEHEHEHE